MNAQKQIENAKKISGPNILDNGQAKKGRPFANQRGSIGSNSFRPMNKYQESQLFKLVFKIHNTKQHQEEPLHPTSFKNIALGGLKPNTEVKLSQKPVSNKPSQNMIRLELEDVEKSNEQSEQEQNYQAPST